MNRSLIPALVLPFATLFAAPPEFPATYVAEGVALKGDLSDPAWKDTPEITGFVPRGKYETPQSFVKILYDDKNLYFGVRFEEPEPEKMARRFDQHDLAIFNDDCFEILFDTRNRPETFYHFAANAAGAIYDSRNGDKNWSSEGAVTRARVGAKEWTVELAIPFADLGIPAPVFGESWGLRLCRERKVGGREESSLPAVTAATFFSRGDLGRLVFQNNPNVKSPLAAEMAAPPLQWGLNRVPVALKNSSGQPIRARVTATSLNARSEVIDTQEREITVPAHGESEAVLEIPVTSDLLEQTSISVADAEGKTAWGALLKLGFAPAGTRLAEIEKRLPLLRSDLLLLQNAGGPIFQELLRQVEEIAAKTTAFREKVAAAVKEKTTLPAEAWDTLRPELEAFGAWRAQRDFAVWETDPWQNGSPADLPASLDAPPALAFRQAGNEREARALMLAGLLPEGRSDVRVVVNDFKRVGEPESFVSRDRFHIYHAPWVRDGFDRLISDPLVETADHALTLTAGRAEKVWVVFDSRGVPPGEYEGDITVKPVDVSASPRETWKRIPFRVTVLDFTLPETDQWPLSSFFFGPGVTPSNETELLRLYHAYHINWMMTNRFAYMWEPKNDGTKWVVDPKGRTKRELYYDPAKIRSQDRFLREARELKMNLIFGWNATRNLEWFREMMAHLRELGFPDEAVAFQGMNDEFHAEDIPRHMEYHRAMHAQDPRVQFMATLTSVLPPDGPSFEQLEEPARYVKLWIHSLTRLWPDSEPRSRENLEWFRQRDRILWTYTCRQQMQNYEPNDYYRLSPWRAWLGGVDGVAMWTAMASRGDGWDHGDGFDEGILFRGLDRGPVPTKRLEAFREGLEDVAYMAILKETIAKAKEQKPVRDFSAEERLISEIPREIEKQIGKNSDIRPIVEWREKAADAILRLSKTRD